MWTSTKNVWNANNAMLSRASSVFGPWIKWNSGTGAVPFSPNCRFLFTVYVAFEPLSPQNKSTVLLQDSLKTQSYHGEINTKFYFRFQNISLPQEPNMYNRFIKNHPQCVTHYNLVQLCHICINRREALSIVLARTS